MALINCPECGKIVSALATACPNCGHPISQKGPVSIKIAHGFHGTIRVVDVDKKMILWEGRAGEVARFDVDGPTNIGINWSGIFPFSLLQSDIYYVGEESITCVKANEKYEFKQGPLSGKCKMVALM